LPADWFPYTVLGMDEPNELQHNGHWKVAVWALRVGLLAIATIVVGIIVLSFGGTPWVLATGVIFWLACAVVIATGFLLTLHDLPDPRPGFWSMRWMIIHDAIGLEVQTGVSH
jgi:hypothetical protein